MSFLTDSYLAAAIRVSQVWAGRWALGAVVLLVVGHHGEYLAAQAAPEEPLRLEHTRHSHFYHGSSDRNDTIHTVQIMRHVGCVNSQLRWNRAN